MKTEQAAEAYENLDLWSFEQSIATLIKSNQNAVSAVQQALPELSLAADGIKQKLLLGGRLIYMGAGTSGRLALQDAAELPPTFGFERSLVLLAGGTNAQQNAKEDAEDDREDAIKSIKDAQVNNKDALVAVAASGQTPYTVAGLEQAKAQGALTIGIANNPESSLLEKAHVSILLNTGPEVLAGSTRLAAGTAQKIALNALSTAVLSNLGGAYKNLMVGMRPSNEKLERRAVSMVSQAAKVEGDKALETLERADWQIREAIVMLKTQLSFEEARASLVKYNNRVRDVLKEA